MRRIINNAMNKLNGKSTLDEIKAVLSEECYNASFEITMKDWNYMMTEILYRLGE